MISAAFANKVFDVLVEHASVNPSLRDNFVYIHTHEDCREYRVQGALGFGGKYRARKNTVDCYPEDETAARRETIQIVNALLAQIPPDDERGG